MTGAETRELLLLGIALGIGVLAFLGVRRAPALMVAGWLGSVCLVPVWVKVTAGVTFEPQTVAALGCLAALVPLGRRVRDRFTLPDALMVGLVAAGLAGIAVGEWSVDAIYRLLVPWSGAYLLGRLLWRRIELVWVYRAIAVAFTGVAVLALVEAVTGVNPFLAIPSTSGSSSWTAIQIRGGTARTEGAFGHSIALGGCLATAVPMTVAARLRPPVTVVAVGLMGAAAVVTFSRIGMGTLALGLVLTVLFLPTGLSVRLRAVLGAAIAVATAIALPFVTAVFGAAGDEATDSAAYRGDLVSLFGTARWLGLAESAYRAPDGRDYFGTFRSIDNALLLLALNSGLLALGCVLAALAAATVMVLRRRATAPTIALVAQIPAFATVALITQYSTWVWFVAGLAAASQVAGSAHHEPPDALHRRANVPRPSATLLPRSAEVPSEPVVPAGWGARGGADVAWGPLSSERSTSRP